MTSRAGSPLFATPRVTADRDGDAVRLRSAEPLGEYPVSVMHTVREHARLAPDQPMIAERDGRDWRRVTYAGAVAAAGAIGQGLLDRGLGPGKPLLILSGNSVDHLLVTLGAMTAGIPVAPVSVAYSLQSRDHARIRAIAGLIGPGAVFAEDAEPFGPALDALPGVPVIVSRGDRPGAEPLPALLSTEPGAAVAAAFAGLRRITWPRSCSPRGRPAPPRGC